MSQRPSENTDDDEISLAVSFQGLRVSVVGPAKKALDFVNQLVPEADRPSEGASSSAGQAAGSRSTTRPTSLLAHHPCPAHLLDLASKLSAASVLTPEERVRRAWLAGLHAKSALEGTVPPALGVAPIDLPYKFFAVVRGVGVDEPKIFRSPKDFEKAAGPLAGPRAIGQGFPSETEARVYLEAVKPNHGY